VISIDGKARVSTNAIKHGAFAINRWAAPHGDALRESRDALQKKNSGLGEIGSVNASGSGRPQGRRPPYWAAKAGMEPRNFF